MTLEYIIDEMIWGVSFLLSLVLCPILPGVINKMKAAFGGRKGPPVLQTYYNIFKLLRKGSIYSRTASDVLRLAPIVSFAAVFCAALFVPFGMKESPLFFAGDIILFMYLLALGRVAIVLGALDTGSSFEGMGASREMQFSAMAEGATICALASLVLITEKMNLSGMFGNIDMTTWQDSGPSMFLTALALFAIMLFETCRVPFDDPNTHLELTMIHEAMILDYGGPDLAIITYTAALKQWVLSSLIALMIMPVNIGASFVNAAAFFLTVIVINLVVGIVESIMARFRFLSVPQILIGSLGVALLSIILSLTLGSGYGGGHIE